MLTKVGGNPETIRVSGGILKSSAWTQMLADILQRDIECSDMEQTSMLGAAALALHACNALGKVEDFSVDKGRIVSPDYSKQS
jgi:gluconokinase